VAPIDLLIWLGVTVLATILGAAFFVALRWTYLHMQPKPTLVASPHGPLPAPTNRQLDAAHREFGAPPLEYCGVEWPRDIASERTRYPQTWGVHPITEGKHRCVLAKGHEGLHLCRCYVLDYRDLAPKEGD
jgi:hypothetical protein